MRCCGSMKTGTIPCRAICDNIAQHRFDKNFYTVKVGGGMCNNYPIQKEVF